MATLIATIDEFKQHVALNASTDEDYFALLQPDLLLAEHDHFGAAPEQIHLLKQEKVSVRTAHAGRTLGQRVAVPP